MLLVEDDPRSATLARIVLEHGDFDVVTASNGAAALSLLDKVKPQVIVLDLRLPDMNGLDLASQLRADARTRDVVIVAMTASAMSTDEAAAYAAGCDGYLTKPINVRSFADSIEAHVRKRSARQRP